MLKEKHVSAARWAVCVALLSSLFAISPAAASDEVDDSLVGRVRDVNDRFRDVSVSVAEGYTAMPCVSGGDGGAMGVHYVNAKLLAGDTIDIRRPQAVMYEPKANGRMALVAVEYITQKGPASLEGQLFNFTGAPNRYGLPAFYALHVWAWKPNPKGAFANMNPDVTCEHATGMEMDRN